MGLVLLFVIQRLAALFVYWLFIFVVSLINIFSPRFRDNSVLVELHRTGLLKKRYKDPTTYPGYKVDMGVLFRLPFEALGALWYDTTKILNYSYHRELVEYLLGEAQPVFT